MRRTSVGRRRKGEVIVPSPASMPAAKPAAATFMVAILMKGCVAIERLRKSPMRNKKKGGQGFEGMRWDDDRRLLWCTEVPWWWSLGMTHFLRFTVYHSHQSWQSPTFCITAKWQGASSRTWRAHRRDCIRLSAVSIGMRHVKYLIFTIRYDETPEEIIRFTNDKWIGR